jgi:hypothetical protein
VLIRGVASRVEIDCMATMLTPNALFWSGAVPLRLRHGASDVGEILSLRYSFLGDELTIEARVDDPEAARMPCLSVAFTPDIYEFVDGPVPFFRVSRARLDECSLTDRPALRSAKILARCPAGPRIEDPYYRAIANKMAQIRLTLMAA